MRPSNTPDELSSTRAGGRRENPLTRSWAGLVGLTVLLALVLACLGSLPWTLASAGVDASGASLPPRYKHGDLTGNLLPPSWARAAPDERARADALAAAIAQERLRKAAGGADNTDREPEPTAAQIDAARPYFLLGTDKLGRDLFVRCLTGGGVSIGIGLAAAAISVFIGTLYGALAGYAGGRIDAVMMRVVDVLYGLPYLLLVVLLAVAGDALVDSYIARTGERAAWVHAQEVALATERGLGEGAGAIKELRRMDPGAIASLEARASAAVPARDISDGARAFYEVAVLLIAIGGLSWLTMARVIRGQVLSLKAQPFMEAARAMGTPIGRQFTRHLLPNLLAPIIVYATLTVPQAILQESFLSFLGIGVRPPLPSWGNLAAEGLVELNPVRVRWWLIVFPCVLLGVTLLALNFVGEGLREAFDPRRARK